MSDKVVCPYYSVGYCKFGDQCLKEHFNEDCNDMTCKRIECPKTHKQLYKYGSYCKRHIRNRSCEFRLMISKPLDNEKGHKKLSNKFEESKDSGCQRKLKVHELQSMNTEMANLLKTFTIFVEKRRKERL